MKTYDEMAKNVLERRNEYRIIMKKRKKAVTATVLSLAVAVGAGFGAYTAFGKQTKPEETAGCYDPDYTENAEQTSTTNTVTGEKKSTDDKDKITTASAQVNNGSDSVSSQTGEWLNAHGFTSGFCDMLGFVYYEGNFYTLMQTAGVTEFKGDSLIGEYLGEAGGNISDINGKASNFYEKQEYQNFDSSMEGKVYTCKGADRNYLLLFESKYNDAESDKKEYSLLINSEIQPFPAEYFIGKNGLDVNNNLESISYLVSDEEISDVKKLEGVSEKDINTFFDSFTTAQYIANDDTFRGIYEKGISDASEIYVRLNNGFVFNMSLFGDGYVMIRNSPLIYKIDSSAFNTIREATKK